MGRTSTRAWRRIQRKRVWRNRLCIIFRAFSTAYVEDTSTGKVREAETWKENLVSYLIEGQRREVIVINPDIKLCREEVLKSSSVNPGVRWAGMDVAEQLPHVVMIASFKAQIREVVQVNFLLSDLYAH